MVSTMAMHSAQAHTTNFSMNMKQLNMHVKHVLWIQLLFRGDKTSPSDRFHRDTVNIEIQMNMFTNLTNQKKTNQCAYISLCYKNESIFVGDTDYLRKKLCRWSLLLCKLMAATIISKTILMLPPFYLHKTFWLLLLLAPNLKSLLLLADLIPIIQAFATTSMWLYLCTCILGAAEKHLSFQHICMLKVDIIR